MLSSGNCSLVLCHGCNARYTVTNLLEARQLVYPIINGRDDIFDCYNSRQACPSILLSFIQNIHDVQSTVVFRSIRQAAWCVMPLPKFWFRHGAKPVWQKKNSAAMCTSTNIWDISPLKIRSKITLFCHECRMLCCRLGVFKQDLMPSQCVTHKLSKELFFLGGSIFYIHNIVTILLSYLFLCVIIERHMFTMLILVGFLIF